MLRKITNIVFGELAKTTLRDAFAPLGTHEKILTFPDDLSFGPIYPPNGLERQNWIRENFRLHSEDWGVSPQKLENFLQSLKATDSKIICWICNAAVDEHCGFDQILFHVTGDNLYFIDTTSFDTTPLGKRDDALKEQIPLKLAHAGPAVASHLFGQEIEVTQSLRAQRQAAWQKIRAENAPLRTIDADGVKSVPASYFDNILLAYIGPDWSLARRVVTFAAVEANRGKFFRIAMIVLAGRLHELAREGRIETAGNASNWTEMNVRLPRQRNARPG